MTHLTAVKVKIGQRPNGHAEYPNFNSLACVKAANQDWSQYIDTKGEGWQYDQISGHTDEDFDSPRGQQWGLLLIPEVFANESVAKFPDLCERLDEAATEIFYDTRAHARDDDHMDDQRILALKARLDLEKELGIDTGECLDCIKRALDKNDPAQGLRKNHRKRWSDFKARHGVTFLPGG